MNTEPLALIDADIFLYEASNVTEHAFDYGNDNWVMHSNLAEAQVLFKGMVDRVKADLKTSRIILCVSAPGNFRKELSDTYKSQRKATRKPLIFPILKVWVQEVWNCASLPNLEADDVLGILATEPNIDEQRIIVSTDKDLQTIPGYLWRKGELVTITPEEAKRFWLTQTLTGDPTDGYKGCPGIGPVSAQKILGTMPDYGAVELAYLKAGLTKDDCLLQARFARILHWDDWDHEKQEVKLWEPR